MQLRHRAIEIRLEHLKHGARRQPVAQRPPRVAQESPEPRARGVMWSEPFVDEDQVQVDLVQLAPTVVQVVRAPLDGFVDEALAARCGLDGVDAALTEVLIDAAGLVEQPKRRLESMDDVAALDLDRDTRSRLPPTRYTRPTCPAFVRNVWSSTKPQSASRLLTLPASR